MKVVTNNDLSGPKYTIYLGALGVSNLIEVVVYAAVSGPLEKQKGLRQSECGASITPSQELCAKITDRIVLTEREHEMLRQIQRETGCEKRIPAVMNWPWLAAAQVPP